MPIAFAANTPPLFTPSMPSLFLPSPAFSYLPLPFSAKKWPPSPVRRYGVLHEFHHWAAGRSSGRKIFRCILIEGNASGSNHFGSFCGNHNGHLKFLNRNGREFTEFRLHCVRRVIYAVGVSVRHRPEGKTWVWKPLSPHPVNHRMLNIFTTRCQS